MSPDVPERTAEELHSLYREAATDQPGPLLDRSILEAARAELRSGPATKRRKPWWRTWLPATTAVAAVVIGLSVTWRVMDEQERRVHEEMNAAEAVGDASRKAAPAQSAGEAGPAINAAPSAVGTTRRAESLAIQDSTAGGAAALAQPVTGAEPRVFPAPAAPAAMASQPTEAELKKSRQAESDAPRERRDAATATDSASGFAHQAGKLEAQRSGLGAGSEASTGPSARPAAKSLAAPAVDAATPDAWQQQIRELRAAGRNAEAAQSLARFRARYPDFALPADLVDLK